MIQTAFVGDLLLTIPFLRELRRQNPQDKITVFCRKGLGEILTAFGFADETIEADKTSAESRRKAFRLLRERRFDSLFCIHQSLRSQILARSLSARIKIGYANFWNALVFDRRVVRSMDLPEAMRQLELLTVVAPEWATRIDEFRAAQSFFGGQGQAGSLLPVPTGAEMRSDVLQAIRESWKSGMQAFPAAAQRTAQRTSQRTSVQSLLREMEIRPGDRLAVLAPGSVWATKMWTQEGFSRVADDLLAKGFRVLLLGAPSEKELCEQVARMAPGALSIAGRTSLVDSAEILAIADVFVGNDSGAMHMASLAGVPSVAVFGPTILEYGYRPWQNRAVVVQTSDHLSCRPCGKHGSRSCPLKTHACMKSVSSDSVIAAIETVLCPPEEASGSRS